MKQNLKKWIPTRQQLSKNKWLSVLGPRLRDENLWRLNRRSVAMGVAIGLFCAYIPAPMQMIIAALVAIWSRANLPLSVSTVWISNPLTWIPMYAPAYLFGAAILGDALTPIQEVTVTTLSQNVAALLLGCLVFGIVFAVLGYVIVNTLWRRQIVRQWRIRQEKRRSSSNNSGG